MPSDVLNSPRLVPILRLSQSPNAALAPVGSHPPCRRGRGTEALQVLHFVSSGRLGRKGAPLHCSQAAGGSLGPRFGCAPGEQSQEPVELSPRPLLFSPGSRWSPASSRGCLCSRLSSLGLRGWLPPWPPRMAAPSASTSSSASAPVSLGCPLSTALGFFSASGFPPRLRLFSLILGRAARPRLFSSALVSAYAPMATGLGFPPRPWRRPLPPRKLASDFPPRPWRWPLLPQQLPSEFSPRLRRQALEPPSALGRLLTTSVQFPSASYDFGTKLQSASVVPLGLGRSVVSLGLVRPRP